MSILNALLTSIVLAILPEHSLSQTEQYNQLCKDNADPIECIWKLEQSKEAAL